MTERVTQIARNPWKLTAIGMALVATTALVTGIVMASRSKPDETAAPSAASAVKNPPRTVAQVTARPRVPDQVVVKACNDQAATATGPRDKTVEVVKDGAIGALLGAAVGAAGGAIADGGKGAGKGAAIGGLVGAGAGSLYGVNDNRKHDAAYREAYASCMRSRGYAG
jgi:hypothetical protein